MRLAIAIGLVTLLAACDGAAPEQGPLDRAAVERIVAEYIDNNPEWIAQVVSGAGKTATVRRLERMAEDGDLVVVGPMDAPLTIVEFFDYNCGYCRRALDWVKAQIARGDTRVIFVEAPILESRTGTSRAAALASLAAARQDRFMPMHEALMRADDLDGPGLRAAAASAGLDMGLFEQDRESASLVATADLGLLLMDELQLTGTPSFFVNGSLVGGFDRGRLNALAVKARAAPRR